MRKAIAGFGAAIGLAMLSGCVPPPPPSPVVAVAPPPTVFAAAPVALVAEPPSPVRVVHHHPAAAHPVVHDRVPRYASHKRVLASGLPYCGSPQHPCNVEHVTVPIQ